MRTDRPFYVGPVSFLLFALQAIGLFVMFDGTPDSIPRWVLWSPSILVGFVFGCGLFSKLVTLFIVALQCVHTRAAVIVASAISGAALVMRFGVTGLISFLVVLGLVVNAMAPKMQQMRKERGDE